jgi:hypothetical protein
MIEPRIAAAARPEPVPVFNAFFTNCCCQLYRNLPKQSAICDSLTQRHEKQRERTTTSATSVGGRSAAAGDELA